MNNPGFDKLESELRNGLQALRRGELDQSGKLIEAIKTIGPERMNLVPVLMELINHSNGAVQISAVDAIGRQGKGARVAIDLLTRLLSKREAPVSAAAAKALGSIPDPVAVTTLIKELDRIHLPFGSSILKALAEHGERAAEALPRLIRFIDDPDSFPEHLRGELHNTIEALSAPLPIINQNPLALARFSDFIPIRFSDRKGEDPIIFFSRYGGSPSRLPSQPEHGLLIDQRLRFKTNCESECGLKIYRGAQNENIVVLTGGKGSYGTQPLGLPDELATMIVSYYRMNPERVHWFVVTQNESIAQCKQLKFKFDPKTGEYSQPREFRGQSIRRALRSYGIEW